MKSILISIQPKWCELIASGKKTVEVRKTRPKELGEFKKPIMPTGLEYEDNTLTRPPQSWCYVEEVKDNG